MISRNRRQVPMLATLALLTALLGCRENPPAASYGAEALYNISVDQKISEISLNLHKIKVSTLANTLILEIGYQFPNEATASRTFSLESSSHSINDDGEMIVNQNPPSAIKHQDQLYGNYIGSDGVFHATIDANTPLVSTYPITTIVLDSREHNNAGSTKLTMLEASKVTGTDIASNQEVTPWAGLQGQEGIVIASRYSYIQNTKFTASGWLGCMVQPFADGTPGETKMLFSQIEHGSIYGNAKNLYDTLEDTDELAKNAQLWVQRHEQWHLAALNIRKNTLSIYRTTMYRYLYYGRELPNVDPSVTEPSLSGMENLVRHCNKTAAELGGTFRIFGLKADNSARLHLASNSELAYCPTLKAATASNNTTVALNNTTFGCTTANDSTLTKDWNFTSPALQAGNWDGSKHSGAVHPDIKLNGFVDARQSKTLTVTLR